MVNRMWAHFMGRGIVHPIDDARSTNPPSNPELLDGLAQDFISSGYDLKQLIRVIANSYAYRLESARMRAMSVTRRHLRVLSASHAGGSFAGWHQSGARCAYKL